jgi:hypothetical protein
MISTDISSAGKGAFFLYVNGIGNKEIHAQQAKNALKGLIEGGYFYTNTGIRTVVVGNNVQDITRLSEYIIYILKIKHHLCIIAHSNGCALTHSALRVIYANHPQYQKRIEVHGFGGIELIPKRLASRVHNYIARDFPAKTGSICRARFGWTWVCVNSSEFPKDEYNLIRIPNNYGHTFQTIYLPYAKASLTEFSTRILEESKNERLLLTLEVTAFAMIILGCYYEIFNQMNNQSQPQSCAAGMITAIPISFLVNRIGQRLLGNSCWSLLSSTPGLGLQYLADNIPGAFGTGFQIANAGWSILALSKAIVNNKFINIPIEKEAKEVYSRSEIIAASTVIGLASYLLINHISITKAGLYAGLGSAALAANLHQYQR